MVGVYRHFMSRMGQKDSIMQELLLRDAKTIEYQLCKNHSKSDQHLKALEEKEQKEAVDTGEVY